MDLPLPQIPEDRRGFKIGIICALTLEADMVEQAFDRDYLDDDSKQFGRAEGDPNRYSTGVISGCNVVLAHCNRMGGNRAAEVATALRSSFPEVKFVFVVGICGAVPYITHQNDEEEEVVLGDLFLSTGMVRFDFGRQGPNGFSRRDGPEALGTVSNEILSMLGSYQTDKGRRRFEKNLLMHLHALKDKAPRKAAYPGFGKDHLFDQLHTHTHTHQCEQCNVELGTCGRTCEDIGCLDALQHLKHRERLKQDAIPRVHLGTFGSSSMVLKSGTQRDKLAKTEGIVAFELEGCGTWDIIPTLVVKAASDYADSHKTKRWQVYAASVAAAGLKVILNDLRLDENPVHDLGQQRFVSGSGEPLPGSVRDTPVPGVSIDQLSGNANHLLIGNTVTGGVHYYNHPNSDRNSSPIDKYIPDLDKMINDFYRENGRLSIRRLSGQLLDLGKCYINLALVKRDEAKHTSLARDGSSSSREWFSKSTENGELVPLDKLFESRTLSDGTVAQPRRIFIQGKAGIGKTTLCKKIVNEFLQARLGNNLFDRILWLPLRKLQIKAGKYGWKDLLDDAFDIPLEENWDILQDVLAEKLSSKAFLERTLFLLDGLDEMSTRLTSGSKMHQFVEGILGSLPSLILTSRPQNSHISLRTFDLELEPVGFQSEQVTTYLQHCMQPKDEIPKILALIEIKPLIGDLLRVPIHLDALCFTWRSIKQRFSRDKIKAEEDKSSVTMTILYDSVSTELCRKDAKRLHPELLSSDLGPSDIQRSLIIELRYVEEFAFQGLLSSVVEYTFEHRDVIASHLYNQGLRLSGPYNTILSTLSFFRNSGDSPEKDLSQHTWHFIHLTMQEYFAARHFVRHWLSGLDMSLLHISTWATKETVSATKFLQKNKYLPRYSIFWRFVAGLISLHQISNPTERNLESFFNELNKEPIDLLGFIHHRLLMYCLDEIPSQTLAVAQNGLKDVWRQLKDWALIEMRGYRFHMIIKEAEFPDDMLLELFEDAGPNETILVLNHLCNQRSRGRRIGIKLFRRIAVFTLDTFPLRLRLSAFGFVATFAYQQPTLFNTIENVTVRLLGHRSSKVRWLAVMELRSCSAHLVDPLVECLIDLLVDRNKRVREGVVYILQCLPQLHQSHITRLSQLLKRPEPDVQVAAGKALERVSPLSEDTLLTLLRMIEDSADFRARVSTSRIFEAQSSIPDRVLEKIMDLTRHDDSSVRVEALQVLPLGDNRSQLRLVSLLEDSDSHVRQETYSLLITCSTLHSEALKELIRQMCRCQGDGWAAKLLEKLDVGRHVCISTLQAMLDDEEPAHRTRAISALGLKLSSHPLIVPKLIERIQDQDEEVRQWAQAHLAGLKGLPDEISQYLLSILEDREETTCRWVADIFGAQTQWPHAAIVEFTTMCKERNPRIRECATRALKSQLRLNASLHWTLYGLLEDECKTVRNSALEILSVQELLPSDLVCAAASMCLNLQKQKDAEGHYEEIFQLFRIMLKRPFILPAKILEDLVDIVKSESLFSTEAAVILGRISSLPQNVLVELTGWIYANRWRARYNAVEALRSQQPLPALAIKSLLNLWLTPKSSEVSYGRNKFIRAAVEVIEMQTGLDNHDQRQLMLALVRQDLPDEFNYKIVNILESQDTLDIEAIVTLIANLRLLSGRNIIRVLSKPDVYRIIPKLDILNLKRLYIFWLLRVEHHMVIYQSDNTLQIQDSEQEFSAPLGQRKAEIMQAIADTNEVYRYLCSVFGAPPTFSDMEDIISGARKREDVLQSLRPVYQLREEDSSGTA